MRFQIQSVSRIHMSLYDLNGSLGRIDGGFGLALKDPHFLIEFSNEIDGKSPDHIRCFNLLYTGSEEYKSHVISLLNIISDRYCQKKESQKERVNLSINILKVIPPHRGYGSKTQLLLTLGRGILKLIDIDYDIMELTRLVGRGGTSGIGYMAFKTGKFIIDLGHSYGEKDCEKTSFLPSAATSAPPALPFLQMKFPDDWKIILVDVGVKNGAYDEEEVNIFQKYAPISKEEVEKLSHHILMELIPAIKTQNIELMGKALAFINSHGFKKIEISLQNEYIKQLIDDIYGKFKLPVGMSSFGPLVYIICANSNQVTKIDSYLSHNPHIKQILHTNCSNNGYDIKKIKNLTSATSVTSSKTSMEKYHIEVVDFSNEELFFNYTKDKICEYFFYIYDYEKFPGDTQIFMVLNDVNHIHGIMLEYKNSNLTVRGELDAVKFFFDQYDGRPIEVSGPISIDYLIGNKFNEMGKVFSLHHMILEEKPYLQENKNNVQSLQKKDVSNIVKLMHIANPKDWDDITEDMIFIGKNLPCLGIFKDDKLVCVSINWISEKAGQIMVVATHPDYRNQGLATCIVSQSVELIFRRSKLAMIQVKVDNIPAQAVYKKIGFKIKKGLTNCFYR